MKILSNEVSNKSLNLANSFLHNDNIEFISELNNTDELVLYINPLISIGDILFSAESLTDIYGAFNYFSNSYQDLIIIPQNHIDFYKYPEPTLLSFVGNKLWRTSSRLVGNIFFGKSCDIKSIIEGNGSFNNGIFHQGKYTIIASLPSLIVDLTEEQLPTVAYQMFDINNYKVMLDGIPDLGNNVI